MKIPVNNYEIPKEPGLYAVVWGGSDGQLEAIWFSHTNGTSAFVLGAEKNVDLTKAPWNHPLTKFSEKLETQR